MTKNEVVNEEFQRLAELMDDGSISEEVFQECHQQLCWTLTDVSDEDTALIAPIKVEE